MRNSDLLDKALNRAIDAGEVPYQANRRALKALDIHEDADGGMQEVDLMLAGFDMFIDDLKELEDAARGVAHRAVAALR